MRLCYHSNTVSRWLWHENTHHDPFGNSFVEFCVEDSLLESCQRPISIHQSAPHEHVTVALEVIAGWTGLQRYDPLVEEIGPFLRACAAAGARIHWERTDDLWYKESYKNPRTVADSGHIGWSLMLSRLLLTFLHAAHVTQLCSLILAFFGATGAFFQIVLLTNWTRTYLQLKKVAW